VAVGAAREEIVAEYAGADSRIMADDDRSGMNMNGANEVLPS
jgi:hypothetical protein